jgi:hypothetical protein
VIFFQLPRYKIQVETVLGGALDLATICIIAIVCPADDYMLKSEHPPSKLKNPSFKGRLRRDGAKLNRCAAR